MQYFFNDYYKMLLINSVFAYTFLDYAQERRVRFEDSAISPIDKRTTPYYSRPNSKGHLDWCIRIAQQRNDEENKQHNIKSMK